MSSPLNPAMMATLATLKQALAAKDRAATNQAVERLLSQRAPLGPQWRQLAELMRVSGEMTLAVQCMDRFVTAAGGTPQAQYAKVVLLTQSSRIPEAYELLASLPEDVPDRAGHAYVLGNIAMTLGNTEQARAHLETALDHRPGWGPAWLTLATMINFRADPLADRLLAEASVAEQQGPADLARYCYALGKLHADRREPEPAFKAYARGGALLRSETPYSLEGNARNAREAMTGYPPGFFERLPRPEGYDTSRPIFVTGLPRSGTTLVEQILTSHSAVRDGAEINIIQHIAVAAKGVSGEALDQYLSSGGSIGTLAGLYLHLLDERFGPGGRIVDKTIDVSRCLGLIAAALPDAPLIWMRRDPLDSAWSCFRTFFIHGVAWSYSLEDIAHHFRLEDQLMAFWKDRLGDRLLVVPYGELVDAPEQWTRRILDHCGLEEEAAVFTPHKTERLVATASSLQVRRPINKDGLGVAEPYRPFMQPFIDAYQG